PPTPTTALRPPPPFVYTPPPPPAAHPATLRDTHPADVRGARGAARIAAPPAAGPRPGARALAPVVRHCDEFRPEPWIIEAFARIAAGDRLRALAFRLERGDDHRWRCAAIDLGPAPGHPGPR
ncbi:Rv3235 family protein, partial [Streptomyces sp. HSW2009]|uniref:Rv3235 family protein n=1 Tax=Streptomyces sp. HSW2009 TaxID=3142890 RepID=UPI0032F0527A